MNAAQGLLAPVRLLTQAFFLLLALGGVALFVVEVHDARQPVVWGTFTAERCDVEGRGGSVCHGSWVSDDGTRRAPRVVLDGHSSTGEQARACMTVTGLNPDSELGVVHTRLWRWGGLVTPPLLVAFSLRSMTQVGAHRQAE